MKTIEEIDAKIEALKKEKTRLRELSDKKEFWQRVINERWMVGVSNESQGKADTAACNQTTFLHLSKHDPESECPFQMGTLKWKYCSTKQWLNIRQPHDGGKRPVSVDTMVTVWKCGDCPEMGYARQFNWEQDKDSEPILSYMIHPNSLTN